MIKRRCSRFFPFSALIVLVLIFFNKMAFSNLILARGDTFLYFYPYWEVAAEALKNGRVPLWNPDIFMGVPFLANSQVGFFYPLNWLVWLLFPTPYAVSASILLHLIIAGCGTYLAARRLLSLSQGGALITAVLFALGGYMTAQVEHINQFQGLAWLPWVFMVLSAAEIKGWRMILRRGTAVAILISLQLLAGHSQTVFITGVGGFIFVVANGRWRLDGGGTSHFKQHVSRIAFRASPLFVGAFLAFFISAIQLLPTLELAQHSSRQGGLAVNEVLSFSWHPLLMGQSLLPGYGQSLFTEYVAFLPLTALVLAILGTWQWRSRPALRPILLITVVALLLALGQFNPLYWLLARLPGFNLFRVPARWLVLYALGMALLAGAGWDLIRKQWQKSREEWRQSEERPWLVAILLILFLVGWRFLAVPLAEYLPLGAESVVEYPTGKTILGWFLELSMLGTVLIFGRKTDHRLLSVLPILTATGLFLASRALPFNNLTTPEAYFDLRSPSLRLQAENSNPPGRVLSLSDIFFDPGDQGEIDTIYADQLSDQARYDYTVAVKQKEIIAPNLPMTLGLASVDGFDGGILPLSSYSESTRLLLPNQTKTVDGRLREYLTAVPDPQWLDLFNTKYLITDKTGDAWRTISPEQDIFFDLQHPITLAPGESLTVGHLSQFPATDLMLIADNRAGMVQVAMANSIREFRPKNIDEGLLGINWPSVDMVKAITLTAPLTSQWQIQGLTLLNEETHTFQPLVPGNYRLRHSGDVKIYENMDVMPRAFFVQGWRWESSVADSITAMNEPAFDPRKTAILVGQGEDEIIDFASGQVDIVSYEPEQIVVAVTSETSSLLVLTDAYYPGWEAMINGIPEPLYQADGLFRAVMIPEGQHEVVFSFIPRSYETGRLLSIMGLIVILVLVSGRFLSLEDNYQPTCYWLRIPQSVSDQPFG